jgi:hypothetical protein
VLKKDSRNSKEGEGDVPADNPIGTMGRFKDGLRRVIHAPKAGQAAPRKSSKLGVSKKRK